MHAAWVLMKFLSIPVAILILVALPLTATAVEYGPGRAMLAASDGAPQLPTLGTGAASAAPMEKPDLADATGAGAPAAPAPVPPPHAHAPASHHADKPAHPGKAAAPPTQASWQSLLPGSIQ